MPANVRSADGPRRTRAEWHADVMALFAEGLNGQEIARRTGLCSSFVYELRNDPTGEKAQERKERARGKCVDCGGRTYDRKTVRCDACRKAFIEPEHGTISKYGGGCRCDACRAENTRVCAERRRYGVAPNHGTFSGYQNYGCRCEPCREAFRNHQWLHYDEIKRYPSTLRKNARRRRAA